MIIYQVDTVRTRKNTMSNCRCLLAERSAASGARAFCVNLTVNPGTKQALLTDSYTATAPGGAGEAR
jgi:hypothetical protein